MKKETETVDIQKHNQILLQNLYSTKLEHLDEMNDFIHTNHIPKLNHVQINHMKSHITPKEIEEVIRSLPTKKKKKAKPEGFSEEFYQTFKEDLTRMLLKIFHKRETEGKLPNSLYEAIVTLIPKTKRHNEEYLRTISRS